MGILHKPDGRWLVGLGVENGNEYAGSMGFRDIVIQLTASGATDKSMEYLAFLLDYAVSHYAVGEPIVPPNVSVYISTNGYVKAVQADDYSTDGTNFEVGGIKWNGSAWDFSNAGQGGSGGGGSGVLVTRVTTESGEPRLDKTWQELYDASNNGTVVIFAGSNAATKTVYAGYMLGIDDVRGFNVHLLSCAYANGAMTYEEGHFLASTADDYPVLNV